MTTVLIERAVAGLLATEWETFSDDNTWDDVWSCVDPDEQLTTREKESAVRLALPKMETRAQGFKYFLERHDELERIYDRQQGGDGSSLYPYIDNAPPVITTPRKTRRKPTAPRSTSSAPTRWR